MFYSLDLCILVINLERDLQPELPFSTGFRIHIAAVVYLLSHCCRLHVVLLLFLRILVHLARFTRIDRVREPYQEQSKSIGQSLAKV
jgi:hypothetical protein